ncbi:hypothetical protein BC937DRAFT_86748 [Endogone sp. FLAS-F59071]|nr:hypothetical protein BC937DRAFT_86748 [Endogone sp. FLAS-F59071]|eukprot:RUS19892.1 hypothetical protein BC937DRAFT_86748 [Endogone sp. FLAS-F59071]
MASAQNPRHGKKPTVVITGGDYYLGHEFARLLLSEKRGDFARLSVTMVHPERGKQLERAGAEIKQIKYDDDNSLTNAFGGEVNWVVLVPDPEEDTRVQYTKKLIDAIQKAGKVANVVVISSAAAEEQEREHLKEFKEIEDYVKEKGQNWVILRLSWISDTFHLWSTKVIERAEFPLTIEKDQMFAPIQLEDVTRAIHTIVHQDNQSHHGQTYTLTGPKKIDGPYVVKALNEAIGHGNVQYKKVTPQELKDYLESLRNRDDDRHKRRFEGQPTDKQIHTILDELEWVRTGAADFRTEDLSKLINSKGAPIEQFFKKHSADFGGRDDDDNE